MNRVEPVTSSQPQDADQLGAGISSSLGIKLSAATWNVSSINNNPFEYWVTHPDPAYDQLMQGVQMMIEDPAEDVPIHQIFTDEMFSELLVEMDACHVEGLLVLESFWADDYRKRMAISGFLKDKHVGVKRLTSMPDRITNTINLYDGGKCYRPTVINAFDGGRLGTIQEWWALWRTFIFHTRVQLCSESQDSVPSQLVVQLIPPILRSKYPAISMEEQAISIPLQILCLAIMDAILLHILNTVEPRKWQELRRTLADALIHNKQAKICQVVESYSDVEVIFIQEASAAFCKDVTAHPILSQRFTVLLPANFDSTRNQNSLILVDRARFPAAAAAGPGADVTAQILTFAAGTWIAPGDLAAASLEDRGGCMWLLASFHGDSNGLSAQPLLAALDAAVRERFPDHVVVVGLDANTYSAAAAVSGASPLQGVAHFFEFLKRRRMCSVWDSLPLQAISTTCNARTFLQTQLNKAVAFGDHTGVQHRHLKDWILSYETQVQRFTDVGRDNTGRKRFADHTVFPTLDFPSDHAIISARLHVSAAFVAEGRAHRAALQTAGLRRADVGSSSFWSTGRQAIVRNTVTTSSQGFGDKVEHTLYDYWGIAQAPIAQDTLQRMMPVRIEMEVHPGPSGSEEATAERVRRLVEQQYRQSVSGCPYPANLDMKNRFFARSEDRSVWIVFSSLPFTMAIHKRWFQVCVFLCVTAFMTDSVLSLLDIVDSSAISSRFFRFEPIKFRGISSSVAQRIGISSLGVLMDECNVLEPYNVSISGLKITLISENPILMNGFWFTTLDGPTEEDPTLFSIQRSSDGVVWKTISYPKWMIRDTVQNVSLDRFARKEIHLSAPAIFFFNYPMRIAGIFAAYCSCIFGMKGLGRRGAFCFALCYILFLIGDFAVACFYSSSSYASDRQLSIYWFCGCILDIVNAYAFLQEAYIIDVLGISFVLSGVVGVLDRLNSRVDLRIDFSFFLFLLWVALPILVASALMFLRYRIKRWVSKHLISSDRMAYDSIWNDLLQNEATSKCLEKLRESTALAMLNLPKSQIKQRRDSLGNLCCGKSLQYWHSFSWTNERGFRFLRSDSTHGKVVTSLDQLCGQAACVDVFLQEKIRCWALASSGYLPVTFFDGTGNPIITRMDSIQANLPSSRVKWVDLKSQDRALEKLLRSYGCDVSKLFDFCRQSIIFENLKDLGLCLDAIIGDKEVEIYRIKNRYDPSFDSQYSGGFRSLILNLCLQSPETRKLGVHTHVCELQLVLKAFSELQTNESHQRYLVFRNCRGTDLWGYLFQCGTYCVKSFKSTVGLAQIRRSVLQMCGHQNQVGHQNRVLDVSEPFSLQVASTAVAPVENCGRNLSHSWDDRTKKKISLCDQHISKCEKDEGSTTPKLKLGPLVYNSNDTFVYEKNSLMDEHFRLCVARHRRFGYQTKHILPDVLAQDKFRSIWDTHHPISAAIGRPWFPKVVTLFAIAWAALLIPLYTTMSTSLTEGSRFRFVVLELRDNNSFPIMNPGIDNLGLLWNGCPTISGNTSTNGSQYFLTTKDKAEMNGWWFTTQAETPNKDPVRFYLDVLGGAAGSEWVTVGSSSSLQTWGGSLLFENGFYDTPYERHQSVYFDMRTTWLVSLNWIGCRGLLVVAHACLLAAALLKHMCGRWIVVIYLICIGLLRVLVCLLYLCHRTGPPSMNNVFVPALLLLINMGSAFFLVMSERFAWHVCLIGGLGYLGVLSIYYVLILQAPYELLGRSGWNVVLNDGAIEGVVGILLSVYACAVRFTSRVRAYATAKADRERYDACWSEILEGGAESETNLTQLFEFTEELQATMPSLVLQQQHGHSGYNLENLRSSSMTSSVLQTIPVATAGPPMVCLDQLMSQAAVLDLYLRVQVQQWAKLSSGHFPVDVGQGGAVKIKFTSWTDIESNSDYLSRVQWPRAKLMERAIDKLYHCYGMDVSRLLDCCRQQIIFADPKSLLMCLEIIRNDHDVEIVRVSNNLNNCPHNKSSCGYRQVVLNVCLKTEDAKSLGLDLHVCEIQLGLIRMARLKTEDTQQYSRYVAWRNMRPLQDSP